jgi:fumarylacetoacetase
LTERFSSAEWRKTSWVESANEAGRGFPLQSLPYCVFTGADGRSRIGVGIGSFVLDVQECGRNGLFDELPTSIRSACAAPVLNPLISCGAAAHAELRARLRDLLDSQANQPTREIVGKALIPMASIPLLKPVMSANYTDFYASIHHATRVGRLFRPEQPLLPNYKLVPIGYHGRASSLVVSGTPVRRPSGQTKSSEGDIPCFGPTRFLDYEIEVGVYVSGGNQLGDPIAIDAAREVAFGICLLNDWSARDMQAWEAQPLGPFLAKSFATSVSPWVVPMAALAPFRCAAAARPVEDPAPLPYLYNLEDQKIGGIDLALEVFLLTRGMRAAGLAAHRLSRANLRDLYWTPAQLIAHHTSNGCNLLPGDLLATGTVSGEAEESAGCLLELTEGGTKSILLPNGESRRALEDGDEVILRGICRRPGFPDVSLGECRGSVSAAA